MWLFRRKGPSGFSSSSTAEEVTEGIDGSALTAIVTGASSGIGSETARVLALRGVHVIMGVRNLEASKSIREAIIKENRSAKIDAMELDLSSMASVRKFASDYQSSGLPLNILINNAGIMAVPFGLSKDNIELQFATNHLGHFLLTDLLLKNMKKTAIKSEKEGRIVNVSSEAHRYTYPEGIRFDEINDESRYNKMQAYGQSKLSNVLHANELARRFKEGGVNITANSLHPGIIRTNLFRHFSYGTGIANTVGKLVFKSVEQFGENEGFSVGNKAIDLLWDIFNLIENNGGPSDKGAATTCYVALHPQVKGVSGEYFLNSNLHKASPHGQDVDLAKKLWDFTTKLLK